MRNVMLGLCVALVVIVSVLPASALDVVGQNVFVKGGMYFSESKGFDLGSGIEVGYSIQPMPFVALDVSAGYYRADKKGAYLSAIPFMVTGKGVLPLWVIKAYAGGGVGSYYKMAGGGTELPAEIREWDFGYHLLGGIEIPTARGMSLLLEGKYASVGQGKFKPYHVDHGGSSFYGGFAYAF